MTAKTLPAASQAPLWGMSNNSAGAVLGLPDASSTILEAIEPEPAPEPRGAVWLAFTGDHNEDDAAATFQRRYGQLPRYIFDGLGGLLLVGPVPGLEGGV